MPGTPTPLPLYRGQPGTVAAVLYTALPNTGPNPAPGATAIAKSF